MLQKRQRRFFVAVYRKTEYYDDSRLNACYFLSKGNGVLNGYISLDRIPLGDWVKVAYVGTENETCKRLYDIGLVEGTKIKCVGQSPMGDPRAYLIRGTVIAIRNCDGKAIGVFPLSGGDFNG